MTKTNRGRRKGPTLQPEDERPAAHRRYLKIDKRVKIEDLLIGEVEIEAHTEARTIQALADYDEVGGTLEPKKSTASAQQIAKMINTHNLIGSGYNWVSSNFHIPFFRDRVTGQYYDMSNYGRESIGRDVDPVVSRQQWDRDYCTYQSLSLSYQKACGRHPANLASSYGSMPPKPGRTLRGRPLNK